jgi:predicted site-specific integrase-resolvase
MDNELYISPARLTKKFDVTSNTLRRWAEEGKIRCLRPNSTEQRGGKRIYNVEDVKRIFGISNSNLHVSRSTVCYARVSSTHQKQDLERQIQALQTSYPGAKVIKDIGSGLNWNRPGLKSLLELVHSGAVEQVVVAWKDRLCRFGFELLDWIFQKSNVKLVVLGATDEVDDPSRELSEDLLAITTVFVAKHNGLRAAHNRRQRERANQETS